MAGGKIIMTSGEFVLTSGKIILAGQVGKVNYFGTFFSEFLCRWENNFGRWENYFGGWGNYFDMWEKT